MAVQQEHIKKSSFVFLLHSFHVSEETTAGISAHHHNHNSYSKLIPTPLKYTIFPYPPPLPLTHEKHETNLKLSLQRYIYNPAHLLRELRENKALIVTTRRCYLRKRINGMLTHDKVWLIITQQIGREPRPRLGRLSPWIRQKAIFDIINLFFDSPTRRQGTRDVTRQNHKHPAL